MKHVLNAHVTGVNKESVHTINYILVVLYLQYAYICAKRKNFLVHHMHGENSFPAYPYCNT